MKIITLTLGGLALLCLSFSKEKKFTPPGTVQINDTLFADETEISNFAWHEYEYWTKSIYGKESKEYAACLPDTTVWKANSKGICPYIKHYYRHSAYLQYPVVGITYEQATAFCKWRTDRVKTYLTIKKDYNHQNFEYRLPTKTEWEKLAETSRIFLNNEGKNNKGIYQLNCLLKDANGNKRTLDNESVTTLIKSYWKNWFGLYNMLGNVAEMINEKGICKGGSWTNTIEECRVGLDTEYKQPNAWLGFRCVCVVKK